MTLLRRNPRNLRKMLLALTLMSLSFSTCALATPESSAGETLVFDAQEQTIDYSAPEESTESATKTAATATTATTTTATTSASAATKTSSTSAASAASTANATVDLDFDNNILEVENELQQITTAAAKSGDSSLGEQVVNYARQYIGNSYRYGGSSLTSGTDCSGFVMSIFRHFGISLPHSSQALNSVGTAVSSLSEAKLGDILVYPGHCGIYIGNGKLLSALNSKKGITICSATYNRITAIRRVL